MSMLLQQQPQNFNILINQKASCLVIFSTENLQPSQHPTYIYFSVLLQKTFELSITQIDPFTIYLLQYVHNIFSFRNSSSGVHFSLFSTEDSKVVVGPVLIDLLLLNISHFAKLLLSSSTIFLTKFCCCSLMQLDRSVTFAIRIRSSFVKTKLHEFSFLLQPPLVIFLKKEMYVDVIY